VGRYLSILASSGAFAKIILLVLFLVSVVSWAVIIRKFLSFRRAGAETRRFRRMFPRGLDRSLPHRREALERLSRSPLAAVGLAASEELSRAGSGSDSEQMGEVGFRNLASGLERRISEVEDRLLSHVTLLATVASVSPFLGLLGTVWGVMKAFMDIRMQGSAHISVVAPGIADALITTVAGLLVAIPALVAHNYFVGRVRLITSEMERLSKKTVENLRAERYETDPEPYDS
jgi:biopolymer transport protein TolQ